MKTIITILLVTITLAASSQGFIRRLRETAQGAAEQTVLNKTSDVVSEKTNEILTPQKNQGEIEEEIYPANDSQQMEASKAQKLQAGMYTKFDFIPGDEIIYYRDFSEDADGELPIGWNTNGSGAVVTLSKLPGSWLQLHQASDFLTDNEDEFSDNFTVEFDLVYEDFGQGIITYPAFWFGFLASGSQPTTSNQLFDSPDENFLLLVNANLIADSNGNSTMQLSSTANFDQYFHSGWKKFPRFEKLTGQAIHVSIQVQQERFRLWMNEEKLFDVPKAIVKGSSINQLYFKVSENGYSNDQVGLFISNLKIAKGIADPRHQLVDEGKFSTSGILFDVAQSTIKPESYGILKEIGELLNEHSMLQIQIIGHTDADGNEVTNLKLSGERALAVKQFLNQEFGIDESRMKTSGQGESQPIAENTTPDGKAKNRRVEFISLN